MPHDTNARDTSDAAINGAAAATSHGSVPGTVVSTAYARSGTSGDFVEIRAIGQRVLLVQCRRNGTPIRTRAFQTIEQAREEATRWCSVVESDWRSQGRPPKQRRELRSDAADYATGAMRIIDQGFAVLSESTAQESLSTVLSFAFCGAIVCLVLIEVIAFAFAFALGLPFSPAVIALACPVIFVLLAARHWKRIGASRTYIDVWQRELVYERAEPYRTEGVGTVRVPFTSLLLVRYWQSDDDTHSPSFVIELETPWLPLPALHIEYARGDPAVAEATTSEIAAKLVAVTGIKYLDVQNTRDSRYRKWFNSSLPVAGDR